MVQIKVPGDPVPSVPEEREEEEVDMTINEKQLCQAFSQALLDLQDVDEQDAEDQYLCSEYVKEIYKYLHELEVSCLCSTSR